ncbi:hypothetical protein ACFWFF_25910 [Streptomyces sp. NPDC060223]|uniref:hypothetical protein n=1 Tax=unclassified Streptomyces TaxID=2593676 RepID=UPI00363C529A
MRTSCAGPAGTADQVSERLATLAPADADVSQVADAIVLLPAWTKRRHVDLCRTHAALCR